MPGPTQIRPCWRSPKGSHAGDPVLLGLLGGAVPPDAERLAIEGGGHEGRAWRQGGDLLLVTRAYLLSPGPWAAERGSGGRWAYRLPDTPQALVSARGREIRLSFRSMKSQRNYRTSMMNDRSIAETPRNRRMAIHRLPAPAVCSLLICALLAASSGWPGSAWLRCRTTGVSNSNPEDSVPPGLSRYAGRARPGSARAARQQGDSFVPIFFWPWPGARLRTASRWRGTHTAGNRNTARVAAPARRPRDAAAHLRSLQPAHGKRAARPLGPKTAYRI